jgi:hypothetical protein
VKCRWTINEYEMPWTKCERIIYVRRHCDDTVSYKECDFGDKNIYVNRTEN